MGIDGLLTSTVVAKVAPAVCVYAPLRSQRPPPSNVTVPLLVIVVGAGPTAPAHITPSDKVLKAMSIEPPVALLMLTRRYRLTLLAPPPPRMVFSWPVLVSVTPDPHRMLRSVPASPRTMVPALVILAARSTSVLLAGMVSTWPAATPGVGPVPVKCTMQLGQFMMNCAAPAFRSSSRVLPVCR